MTQVAIPSAKSASTIAAAPSGVTARLARTVAAIKYGDLTPGAIQRTKEVLLDSIGCALGAYAVERGKIAVQLGESFGTKCEATAIGYKQMSAQAASFVNGELVNALDFDLIGPLTGHVVPYVLPTPLALGEMVEANGKSLLTALAVAIDVGGRAVGSLSGHKWPIKEPPYYEEAPRASYNSTIFGAISGGAKLLGLNEMQLRSAYGIGGTSTPLPGNIKWEYLDEGSNINVKYGCWSGWVAMLGTVAALAAQRGLKGDTTILDTKFGYWQMYGSPFFKEDMLLGDLGKVWRLETSSFKSYPACYLNHSPIMGIERLIRENNIRPEDIDEIIVYGDPLMETSNRFPADIKTNEDAQFSHAYLYALAAVYDGTPGPQWHLPSSWNNPKVKALMPKVKVKLHPKASEFIDAKIKAGGLTVFFNSLVEIKAKGKKFSVEVPAPKGSPADPMTTAEIEKKFRHNTLFCLIKQDKVDQIIDLVWNLEKLDNVASLTRLLTIDS